MDFDNKFSDWGSEGAEPSADLKESGFTAGYKPPASIFNWFWSKVIKAITEIQTKLSKVDNTPDSEKAVAFASEAGVGRKVKYPFTFRLNGGSTEGTDLWTFDGSTSRSVNLTPDKLGAAKKTDVVPIVTATSTDGATYTATVDGVTELYNGLEIVIIPNMTSTKAAVQFDLNGLGVKNVRTKINGYNNGNSGTIAALAGWIGEGVPLAIRYISKFDNWQTVDFSRPSATGLYGTIDVEQGGTGATTAEQARENLGVPSVEDIGYLRSDIYDIQNRLTMLTITGSYTGDGGTNTFFTNLGYKPKKIEIMCERTTPYYFPIHILQDMSYAISCWRSGTEDDVVTQPVSLTWTDMGVTITSFSELDLIGFETFNEEGVTYRYIIYP